MKVIRRKLAKSDALWAKAINLIPCGTQTLSKAPNQFIDGVSPKYLAKGKGAHVTDVDGNDYIDYPMALGAIILGHAYPAVNAAVTKQIKSGSLYTLMHPLEVEVAELLADVIPCAERVRFGKNGSDVTMAAVRVARAATGREKIAYCGYHGWQDWFAVTTPRNKGIPAMLKDLIHPFEFNNPASLAGLLAAHPGAFAAVIMEQGAIEPQDKFLHKVRDLAHKHGALFILDEIVTGFRFAPGGAQQLYGVTPDLACFGKAMGNGFPISALVGKKEYMKELDEVFFSMTFGGDTASLAAAAATLKELKKKDVCAALWKKGRKLFDGFNTLSAEIGSTIRLIGHPPRMAFSCKDWNDEDSLDVKSLFLQEAHKRGVLFGGPVFPTFSHSDKDITRTLEASADAMRIVKKAVEEKNIDKYMEGKKLSVVFRPQSKVAPVPIRTAA